MFLPGSRYENQGTVKVDALDGRAVTAVNIPRFTARQLRGHHLRKDIHRLDHIAKNYLGDATLYWKLCEANESPCPDALAARPLVAVPTKD